MVLKFVPIEFCNGKLLLEDGGYPSEIGQMRICQTKSKIEITILEKLIFEAQ